MKNKRKSFASIVVVMSIFMSISMFVPSTVTSIEPPFEVPSFLRVGDILFIESKHEHSMKSIVMFTSHNYLR